jgi:hypothetical protein
MRAIVNLSRLELVKDAHRRGYDRAIWLDADVLVFRPELFTIDVVEGYAFSRETWVTRVGDRWRAVSSVNNCVFACMRDEPDLDALISFTRHIGVHRKITKSLQTGTYLLTGLQQSLAFETLDNVGLFSNHVVKALANNDEEVIRAQAIGHETPVFAANLCASDRDPPPVSESEADLVVDRLLQTRGDIVNRWLLDSPNNLLNVRPKPGMAALFPHEVNVKLQFKQKHGYEPDLANPRTYNERITARKLNLTQDIYRDTADKFAVRDFVKQRVGEEVLIPLLQVADRAEDIDFDALPRSFILKPTHGSGWKEIVRDKSAMDAETVRATMRKWLRTNFFYSYFETHYRDIPRRIIAEELMSTTDGRPPDGYNLYAFHGRVRVIAHHYGQPKTITRYDPLWRRLIVRGTNRATSPYDTPRPTRLARMIEVAEALTAGLDFVRVDLYCFEDQVRFGEMTYTPTSGLSIPTPRDFDDYLGRLWGGATEPIPERFYADSKHSRGTAVGPARLSSVAGAKGTAAKPAPPAANPTLNRVLLKFGPLTSLRLPVSATIGRGSSADAAAGRDAVRRPVKLALALGSNPKTHSIALVSCLMTARDLSPETRFAIASYRRQTWRRRELIIVDASEGSRELSSWIESLEDPTISLIAAPEGAEEEALKRAAEGANGTYLCRWDADVFFHPARIEAELAGIRQTSSRAALAERGLKWTPRQRRIAIFGAGAAERTLFSEKPVYLEFLDSEPAEAMATLMRSQTVVHLDLPELHLVIDRNGDGTRRSVPGDEATLPNYDEGLALLGGCYPVTDYLRATAEAAPQVQSQDRDATVAAR